MIDRDLATLLFVRMEKKLNWNETASNPETFGNPQLKTCLLTLTNHQDIVSVQAMKIDVSIVPAGDLTEQLKSSIPSKHKAKEGKSGVCVTLIKIWKVLRLVLKSNLCKLTPQQSCDLSSTIAIFERIESLCRSEQTEETNSDRNEKSHKQPENEKSNPYLGNGATKPPNRFKDCACCGHLFTHEPSSNKQAAKDNKGHPEGVDS